MLFILVFFFSKRVSFNINYQTNLFRYTSVYKDWSHENRSDVFTLFQNLRVLITDGSEMHSRTERHSADVPQITTSPCQSVHVNEMVIEIQGEIRRVRWTIWFAAVLHVTVTQHLCNFTEIISQHFMVYHCFFLLGRLINNLFVLFIL